MSRSTRRSKQLHQHGARSGRGESPAVDRDDDDCCRVDTPPLEPMALRPFHAHARLAVTAAVFSAACVLLRRSLHDRLRTTLAIGRLVGRLAHALVPWRRAVMRENMQRLAVTLLSLGRAPAEDMVSVDTALLAHLI